MRGGIPVTLGVGVKRNEASEILQPESAGYLEQGGFEVQDAALGECRVLYYSREPGVIFSSTSLPSRMTVMEVSLPIFNSPMREV